MYIRYEKKVIELTKTEKAEAEKFGTQMYRDLAEARRDNPGFRVVEIKVKKTAKTPLDSLNLPTIRAYVKANGSPDQKQTFLTISTATIDDNGIYHAAQDFFSIKKWFLAEFPLYKAALEKHNAEIINIYNAIDAKIASAKKQAAEEARTRAEAEAKRFMESA